jgi:urease accessory protein
MHHALTLLLSDARFPSGGHAHSGGVEEACRSGMIESLDDLEDYLRGRLHTSGTLAIYTAAAICSATNRDVTFETLWPRVDVELDARMVSPAARLASRQQGGQLFRTAVQVFGGPVLSSLAGHADTSGRDPHHPVALGAVAAAAEVSNVDAAAAAGYAAISGPASAAVRLLGLDPSKTAGVIATLAREIDPLAAEAARAVDRPGWRLAKLPSYSAPVGDLLAEEHMERKERLFAS